MFLTDLADAARKSGLRVVEIAGWKKRGALDPKTREPRGLNGPPQTIVCHHTGTSARAQGDYPTLSLIQRGRSDLPGPLAQIGLGRDGTVYVIAAGRANHAGETWLPRQGNGWAIGIEAEHPGGTATWTPAQRGAYVRLVRALADHYEIPLAHVQSHAEVASPVGRKVDPNFPMPDFRREVASLPTSQEDDMANVSQETFDRLAAQVADLHRATVDTRNGQRIEARVAKIDERTAALMADTANLAALVRESASDVGVPQDLVDALAADVVSRISLSVREPQ